MQLMSRDTVYDLRDKIEAQEQQNYTQLEKSGLYIQRPEVEVAEVRLWNRSDKVLGFVVSVTRYYYEEVKVHLFVEPTKDT